jgi:hypothetical protein
VSTAASTNSSRSTRRDRSPCPRFRQTVGWFINRLPGRRVALGIQYGHLQLTMSEAYGSRAGIDMTEILDLERARTLADTLTQAADRLHAGEHVSGPAAERYQASAAEFTAAYQGSHLTARQYRALLNNPRLRVFDHDDALLACNHNPLKAICDPHRGNPNRQTGTPSFDRCNTACANVARRHSHRPGPARSSHPAARDRLRPQPAANPAAPSAAPPDAPRDHRPARAQQARPRPISGATPVTLEPPRRPAAQIATGIGQLLAQAATAAGDRGTADAEEITAITDAMIRLLAGVPLRSDGKLTIKSLATEAGLLRNKLTHKHTGLKDLFNALVKAQNIRPAFAEDLHRDNKQLRDKLAKLTQEREDLKTCNEQFARVIHVLEVENQQLRAAAAEPDNVRLLHRPPT